MRQTPAKFADLPGKVGGAARQVGNLGADIGAVAQAHRDGVVKDKNGECGKRHHAGLQSGEAEHQIKRQAERNRDQDHAYGDENRRNPDHLFLPICGDPSTNGDSMRNPQMTNFGG